MKKARMLSEALSYYLLMSLSGENMDTDGSWEDVSDTVR